MRKKIVFAGLGYFFLGFLFILSGFFNFWFLQMLLKALIMPVLILYFLIGRGKTQYKEDSLIITALIFSWAGDILLQIKNGGDLFFLLGLAAFLLTHILYTIVFFATAGDLIFLRSKALLLIVIIIYGSLTLYTIMPGLGSLQVPVTIYAIIITGMVVAALSRFGKVNEVSYLLVFLGALLFLISDSLIAFNKFKQTFPLAGVMIMCSYLAGQFMIISGTIRQYEKKKTN